MTEPPFAIFSIPEQFEIDGPFVARQVEEPDVPVIAPAFRDPGIDTPHARYLGPVAHDAHGLAQWVRVEHLLPAGVQAQLFTASAA